MAKDGYLFGLVLAQFGQAFVIGPQPDKLLVRTLKIAEYLKNRRFHTHLISFFLLLVSTAAWADDVFLYSSRADIWGVNLTQAVDRRLTTSPFTNSVNGLAGDADSGLVYSGAISAETDQLLPGDSFSVEFSVRVE